MGESEEKVVCFQCGQPVMEEGPDAGPRLNEVPEGDTKRSCKACADRLLEQLPPIFHTPWVREEAPARTSGDYRDEDDYSGEGA